MHLKENLETHMMPAQLLQGHDLPPPLANFGAGQGSTRQRRRESEHAQGNVRESAAIHSPIVACQHSPTATASAWITSLRPKLSTMGRQKWIFARLAVQWSIPNTITKALGNTCYCGSTGQFRSALTAASIAMPGIDEISPGGQERVVTTNAPTDAMNSAEEQDHHASH
ncbi:hypothetical protein PR048_018614 [Dryococelus australis]|uniref:Uncharacterized protein n=1 Tax=Dryococelus australis TaxID=614101 RepID=A0ABQ9HD63_9NEOP|nr:hypothetical protein PR048_018614 [Dryococelus australis]